MRKRKKKKKRKAGRMFAEWKTVAAGLIPGKVQITCWWCTCVTLTWCVGAQREKKKEREREKSAFSLIGNFRNRASVWLKEGRKKKRKRKTWFRLTHASTFFFFFFSCVSVCVKSSSGRTDGTQCTDYKRRKVWTMRTRQHRRNPGWEPPQTL